MRADFARQNEIGRPGRGRVRARERFAAAADDGLRRRRLGRHYNIIITIVCVCHVEKKKQEKKIGIEKNSITRAAKRASERENGRNTISACERARRSGG